MNNFRHTLTAATNEAGLRIWNATVKADAIYQLDRTQYAYARERRNDYLHAVMNTDNRSEF